MAAYVAEEMIFFEYMLVRLSWDLRRGSEPPRKDHEYTNTHSSTHGDNPWNMIPLLVRTIILRWL